MKIAEQALSRVDIAVACASKDAEHRREHLEAALSATGELQRALWLERLKLDPPTTRSIQ
jgi:hypothetical protein